MGRSDQTENLGAPRAQVLDRGGQKATAPQRARDRAGQQAGPHRLVSPGPWSGLRDEVSHRPTCLIVEYGNVRWEIRDDVARSITLTCRGLREDETRWRFGLPLSLIHISEPTRLGMISYAVFCLKKK